MTGSLTGLELFHKKFDLPLAQVVHTEAPYYYRRPDQDMSEEAFTAHLVGELEALIEREGADTIAAFIGEPVLGTGGIVPPPPPGIGPLSRRCSTSTTFFWSQMRWSQGSVVLVQCSARITTAYAPDLITIAKGLTSAYAPLSGSIVGDRMWKVLEQGTDENGPHRPRLDLFGPPDRRRRRYRQS